ncbi:serine hydrolase domain-containing protein [Caulobacter mirabilis]|uniref:Penicillin-binding protein n=1 Tax=Caulobacter mirabilis TaxID=69666 RepID=A0A2D2AV59_9CAUL|nr:serine hydrolase [Caulobacter mirabilis]ATQ41884.1 penicillin-binding protein [Caulobacter mirabilis]
MRITPDLTRRSFTASAISLAAGPPASAALAAPVERRDEVADIDAFVRAAMARTVVVPGLSLAVVEGDRVVMTGGYGVADVRAGTPIDADTGFYIASATKSFTALAIALEADRGGLGLADALSLAFPGSALPSEMAASVTLEDLLSHRSGLDNAPIAFRTAYSGEHTPPQLQALLAQTKTVADAPHGVFRYANAGYNIATTLLERRDGRDWRALVRDRVLTPAGMARTTPWVSKARARGTVAVGHFGLDAGGATPSPLQKVDATMQSAGGLVSTANDMARWLRLQINDGAFGGRRVFPAGRVASTHRSRVAQDRRFGAYQRDGYGLGWQTGRYGEDRFIHHFGNFSGSRSHVSFMPDRRLGVVVLVNEDLVAGELADVVANYVYDRFAGRVDLRAPYEGELGTLTARRDKRQAGLAAAKAERAARPWTLSRPRADYAGAYVNPGLGTLVIAQAGDLLTAKIGVMSAVAEAFDQPETIRVELVPFQGQTIRFDGENSLIFDDARFVRG